MEEGREVPFCSEHRIFFFFFPHCKSGLERERVSGTVIIVRAPLELLTVRCLELFRVCRVDW